jgi:hypothetical protein
VQEHARCLVECVLVLESHVLKGIAWCIAWHHLRVCVSSMSCLKGHAWYSFQWLIGCRRSCVGLYSCSANVPCLLHQLRKRTYVSHDCIAAGRGGPLCRRRMYTTRAMSTGTLHGLVVFEALAVSGYEHCFAVHALRLYNACVIAWLVRK